MVLVHIFLECLLNDHLQTLAKKMAESNNGGFKRTLSKITPHVMFKRKN